ncbi:MAG TPA: sulfotransferase [Allosphingosinicella sp.]
MKEGDATRLLARRAAHARVLRLAQGNSMRAAIARLNEGSLVDAEAIARRHLAVFPDDVAALCLLGDLAARSGIYHEAERLFRRALALQPSFTEAELNLTKLLALRDGVTEALALLRDVLADFPERLDVALQRLALLGQVGDYERAEAECQALLRTHSDRAELWLSFGHLQGTLGKFEASVQAYRRAISLEETCGGAWWGLANLKTYVFLPAEIAQLERLVARAAIAGPDDEALLHFALGKANQDRAHLAQSYHHYKRGNDRRAALVGHDAAAIAAEADRSAAFFTRRLFDSRRGAGHPSKEPIFITGLPRSGSTLVEQILASHPLVEGTAELPYIPMLAHRLLAERWDQRSLQYPAVLEQVGPAEWCGLGQAYLDAAGVHRRTGKPHFIDKLPDNWRYIGFIHLILPNARIIDVRRETMATLWSNYRQWFARGHTFSYRFEDLASYHADYERLMKHFLEVLPESVYRLDHQALLNDFRPEVQSLLADLDLPFDEACISFYENARPVRTASAQQVRRPLDLNANREWRQFEPWLGLLKAAVRKFGGGSEPS